MSLQSTYSNCRQRGEKIIQQLADIFKQHYRGDHWGLWYGLGMALTDGCDWEKIAAAFGLDRQAPTADRDRCGQVLKGGRDTH